MSFDLMRYVLEFVLVISIGVVVYAVVKRSRQVSEKDPE